MSDWRKYERFVAGLMANEAAHDATVIPNAKLVGLISGVLRQVDVLIDSRYGDDKFRRVIVDAKRQTRRIDVRQVEQFESMMKDVGAHSGILVCPNGHTAAALRRAQDQISIRLVDLAAIESFDIFGWDNCSFENCDGLVLWDSSPALEIGGLLSIFATSKCDACRRFNVWCWGCSEKFALESEDEHQCVCKGPWFWLTAIEDDGDQLKAVYLLLVYALGNHAVIDRRPLN